MAAQSVIAAVVAKYQAIAGSFSGPPIWFDGIPQAGGTGVRIDIPYVNLVDEGTTPAFEFEHNPVEVTKFRFEVYAQTLAQVDAIMAGIKYGTGGVTAGGGFDYGTLIVIGQSLMECVRESESRHRAPRPDEEGKAVHMGLLNYAVEAQVL